MALRKAIEPTTPKSRVSGATSSEAAGSPKRTRWAADVPAPVDDFDLRSFAKQMETAQTSMMEKIFEQMRAQNIEKEATLTTLESTARATLAAMKSKPKSKPKPAGKAKRRTAK